MKDTVMILSAEKHGLNQMENEQRTAELESCLRMYGAPFKQVEGAYKGVTEIAFVVVLPARWAFQRETIDELLSLAADFEQESVLVVHANDSAADFINVETRESTPAGTFERVKTPGDRDYTYDVVNDTYYVINS